MNKSFVLNFNLKLARKSEKGTVPIYLRFTLDGTRSEIATKRYVFPEKWNVVAQKVIGNTEEARSLNAYLKSLEQQVYNAHRELMENKMPLTAQNLKKKLYGESKELIFLVEVFKQHNKELAQLVNKEYAPATLKRYETALRHLRGYLKWKHNLDDIDINQIDHAFVTSFDFYLRSVRNCNNNSTYKYVKNFKKIIRFCLTNGWINKDPFAQYKIKIREVERERLTEEELQIIASKNFSTSRLVVARDVFVFCCFTGLAFVDVKNLRRNMISTGIDGQKWIFTNRQKTDTASRIPLLPASLEKLNVIMIIRNALLRIKYFP